jgi:hypothetical protein
MWIGSEKKRSTDQAINLAIKSGLNPARKQWIKSSIDQQSIKIRQVINKMINQSSNQSIRRAINE